MGVAAWASIAGPTVVGLTLAALFMTGAGCGAWGDRLACGDQGCELTRDEWARVQALANVTATPARPDPSNRYLPIADWTTGELIPDAASSPLVDLGWHLYYETHLSGSNYDADSLGALAPTTRLVTCGQMGISCATCHDPAHAGSDVTSSPRHVSIGAGWYDVNSQQTLNAARYPVLYWNGRTDSLWAQAAQVMESPVSMNGYRLKTFWVIVNLYRERYAAAQFEDAPLAEVDALATRLGTPLNWATISTTDYREQFKALSPADQQLITRVHVNAAKAIAAYEWLLSSDGSVFDQFAQESSTSTKLIPAAVRGLKLFIGRASCIDCHNTPMFSDGKFHNIGIPQTGEHVPTLEACGAAPCDCTGAAAGPSCLPSGAFGGDQKLINPPMTQVFHRGGVYDDSMVVTPPDPTIPDQRLLGAWRTPSLRDVARTAPYMHDGGLPTLADVVWHYSEADGAPAVGASELAPLALDQQDRADLIAFLESLTGVAGPSTELVHAPMDLGTPVTSDLCTTPP